jgi:dihydrofolate synthase/folylpolyglutamate synthase
VYLSTLNEWLDWIGSVHQTDIELGLDRIREVGTRLGLLNPTCCVITVGGTNGKGSVVAGLEAIYLAAGFRVGAFTSPILFVHNEEVRVNGVMADDIQFIEAFEKIESARSRVSLTAFEYHTLAAFIIFQQAELDIMILEVGLGGRLDAVNIMDADAAIVTSIGIDHVAWLGDTREVIATEKAGIFRQGKPAICGDIHPPATLEQAAQAVRANFYQQGLAFTFTESDIEWDWQSGDVAYTHLPRNTLLTQNMATVLMAVTLLQSTLPVHEDALRRGLQSAFVPGRIQVLDGPVMEVVDVSHNPAAAAVLMNWLKKRPCKGITLAVFSMLEDKDIPGTLAEIGSEIDAWYVAPLTGKRAAPLDKLKNAFRQAAISTVEFSNSIDEAYYAAHKQAEPGDRVVIFGSFYTVAAILKLKSPAA